EVARFLLPKAAGAIAVCARTLGDFDPDSAVTRDLQDPGPTAAENLGIRGASIPLSPISFLSPYDETVLPQMPWLSRAHALGPRVYGAVLALLKRLAGRIAAPINHFRRGLGLDAVKAPLFDDKHSPELVL